MSDLRVAGDTGEDSREFGLQYLFGVVDTADIDETGRPRYTPIWAFDRRDEKRAFEELVDFITSRRARCPGLHVYHYNHYEPTSVDHLTELHGTRQEAVGVLMGRFATREDKVDDLFRLGVFIGAGGRDGRGRRRAAARRGRVQRGRLPSDAGAAGLAGGTAGRAGRSAGRRPAAACLHGEAGCRGGPRDRSDQVGVAGRRLRGNVWRNCVGRFRGNVRGAGTGRCWPTCSIGTGGRTSPPGGGTSTCAS